MANFKVCVLLKGKMKDVVYVYDDNDEQNKFDKIFEQRVDAQKDEETVLQLVQFGENHFIQRISGSLNAVEEGANPIELNDQLVLRQIRLDLAFPSGTEIKIAGRTIKEFIDSLERYLPAKENLADDLTLNDIEDALSCIEVELQYNVLFGSLRDLVGDDGYQKFLERYCKEPEQEPEFGLG